MRFTRTTVFIAALGTVALLAGSGFAQTRGESNRAKLEDTPKLTVRGEAQLHKPADQLRMRVGVVTEAAEATTALQRNSQQMTDVLAALEQAGLTKDEYETGQFRVQPAYSRRPRQADADWRPKIIGYEVTNTLVIKTRHLELAGELIEAANQAGANSINAIDFDLADPRIHRAEAIAAATSNAIADARTLAEAASVQLVRIISITLDESAFPRPLQTLAARGRMASAEAAPPPMVPGDVPVTARVTIIYEIAPAP